MSRMWTMGGLVAAACRLWGGAWRRGARKFRGTTPCKGTAAGTTWGLRKFRKLTPCSGAVLRLGRGSEKFRGTTPCNGATTDAAGVRIFENSLLISLFSG